MKTAIITTVYNEASNISSFLASILEQSDLPDTLVVVDGGSTDDTFARAECFKAGFAEKSVEFVLMRQQCNIAQGRNIAIHACDAEIICVTDAGVTLDRDWFREIARPLIGDPQVDCVGGNFEIGGSNGVQRAFSVIGYRNKSTNAPSSRSFAFRRGCWLEYPYPEYLKVHEDTRLCNEWRERGFRFAYAPKALVTWVGEDTLLKLYGKYAQYAEWSTKSGDQIDTMRRLQIATYALALLTVVHSGWAALFVVLAALSVRVARQYWRVFRGMGGFSGLRLLPWAMAVQLTLDAAALGGTLRGFYHLVLRGAVQ